MDLLIANAERYAGFFNGQALPRLDIPICGLLGDLPQRRPMDLGDPSGGQRIEWRVIEPLLPNKPKGVPRVDWPAC